MYTLRYAISIQTVSIDRPSPAMPRAHAKASACTCTSVKYHAVIAEMATGYAGVFSGDTLLAKAKCESTSVPVDENGAVTNKKQVVCRICDRSLADSWTETQ